MEQAQDLKLNLMGGWDISIRGKSVPVGIRQQRLIAALAVHGQRSRKFFAGLLWPADTDTHAMGSLRAAVFTIAHRLPGIVSCASHDLCLSDGIDVDLHHLRATLTAHRPPLVPWFASYSNSQLLPGWYDDWVVSEQERLRADYIDAAERLAEAALVDHDHYRALHLARVVVECDPLRESAARILVQAHLQMGNRAKAMQIIHRYTEFVEQELGISPSLKRFKCFDTSLFIKSPVNFEF